MAGILVHIPVPTAGVALSAGVAKTVFQVVAATNHRILVKAIKVSFAGTSTTDTPVTVRVLRQTTAQHTATAEPTAGDVLDVYKIHPQSGVFEYLPIGEDIVVKGGGRLGIEATATQAQTMFVKWLIEE